MKTRTKSGNTTIDKRRFLPADAPKRWYVVASRVEATVYQDSNGKKFETVKTMLNPDGAKFESELDSDRPGRGTSSAGGGTIRHSLDRRFDHKEKSATNFASLIAKTLGSAASRKEVTELVIAAEPHFRGLLRKAMPAKVRNLITHEIPPTDPHGSINDVRKQILKAVQD
jgi:protein required for attachment to host cells